MSNRKRNQHTVLPLAGPRLDADAERAACPSGRSVRRPRPALGGAHRQRGASHVMRCDGSAASGAKTLGYTIAECFDDALM